MVSETPPTPLASFGEYFPSHIYRRFPREGGTTSSHLPPIVSTRGAHAFDDLGRQTFELKDIYYIWDRHHSVSQSLSQTPKLNGERYQEGHHYSPGKQHFNSSAASEAYLYSNGRGRQIYDMGNGVEILKTHLLPSNRGFESDINSLYQDIPPMLEKGNLRIPQAPPPTLRAFNRSSALDSEYQQRVEGFNSIYLASPRFAAVEWDDESEDESDHSCKEYCSTNPSTPPSSRRPKKRSCGYCNRKRHKYHICKQFIRSSERPPYYRCGICREQGHNRRACKRSTRASNGRTKE